MSQKGQISVYKLVCYKKSILGKTINIAHTVVMHAEVDTGVQVCSRTGINITFS